MIDFNFLRIRWPKLAAIAADASRLVEVSPTSAISTMQNFCEWAADIALDFYDIDTPNGTAQPQKLEMLKSTGRVPPEILEKFQSVMNGGTGATTNYRSYRMHDDIVEARRLIEDMQEVARWLHREADRAGWSSPASPSSSRGRATRSMLGPSMSSNGPTGLMAYLEPYMPILLIAGGVILVVGLGIGLAFALSNKSSKDALSNASVVITSTPVADETDALSGDMPSAEPTPPPEQSTYLDEVEPATTPKAGYQSKEWKFNDKTYVFAIDTRDYQHGIGLYVPYKNITDKSNSVSVTYQLDKKYSALKFDLGADANLGYEEKNGKYQLRIYADDDTTPIYDSTQLDFEGTDLGVSVPVDGVTELRLKLTETKGTGKSTLNVVLGNAKLILAGTGTGDETTTGDETGDGTDTGDTGDGTVQGDASTPPSDEASTAPDNDASASPDDSGDSGGSGDTAE